MAEDFVLFWVVREAFKFLHEQARKFMSAVARKLAFALGVVGASGALLAADALFPQQALAQNCASFDPADWPPPARPYFMLVVDTSGSMTAASARARAARSRINFGTDRRAHARRALQKTIRLRRPGELRADDLTPDVGR
jgi:hypothetical protein